MVKLSFLVARINKGKKVAGDNTCDDFDRKYQKDEQIWPKK
jgi:hypothetical protein